MITYDVVVVGAGPAGLSASIEAAKSGCSVLLLDENPRPGGQLYKQIHKFFGMKEHYAGSRGFEIADLLFARAGEAGVKVSLNTKVWGIFPDGSITASGPEGSIRYKASLIILATGASENALSFPGSTLPGIITAGAAQTFANVYHVLPGKEIVMVGSGNVGLIVSYQLMQAGADVKMIVEAMPEVSGYLVHAGKVRRMGVPILLSHTIVRAVGTDHLEAVDIAELDEKMQPVPGKTERVPCDTVCISVGFSPRLDLADVGKCRIVYEPVLGGMLPWHNENMQTSMDRILIAGDLSGVEEASTALDEGRMAGTYAAYKLGRMKKEEFETEKAAIMKRLDILRSGPFGSRRKEAKKSVWEDRNFGT